MKSIFKKFKRLKNIYKIIFIITSIFFIFSIIFLSYNLLLLKNIETILRTIFIVLLYPIYFIYLFISIILLFTKKNKLYITNSIFILILSSAFTILSVNINKTYNIVDNMVQNKITYSTSLITLKNTTFENNKNFIVGMIEDEKDIEGNVLAQKLIDKKNIDKITIKYYSNYLELLNDLYTNKLNGIFISSGYIISYSIYDNYKNIESETKTIYTYKEDMKNESLDLESTKSLTEPFSLLLLGVDSTKNGIDSTAAFNGDTIMLITFNPNTLNATIFSIPRDTYVPIACNGNNENKINSSAAGGVSCVINTVENLMDINIDYFIKINFKGVVDLVDALGGINIDVPISFCEQNSNREFGNKEVCLEKGQQKINGEEALALARHRHSLPTGDFQRIQHQQLIVEATLNESKTIRSIDKFYEVLESISNNIETNINTDEMLNLYNVGKKILLNNTSSLNIEKAYLTGYDLNVYIQGLGNVYTFQYYKQSLEQIQTAMKINLEIEKPSLIKTFNFSTNNPYEVTVIGNEYFNEEKKETLPDFRGETLSYIEEWIKERNITLNIEYITENMENYDETKNNIIIDQNIHNGTLLPNVNKITIKVIKVKEPDITTEENNESNDNSDNTLDDILNIN